MSTEDFEEEGPCYDLEAPLCPECGAPAHEVFERATVALGVELMKEGSGCFRMAGFSRDIIEEPTVPIFEPDGSLQVSCAEGHEWTTRCRINSPAPAAAPSAETVIAKREPYTVDDLIDAVLVCAEEDRLQRLAGMENGFEHPNTPVLFRRAAGIAASLRQKNQAE